MLWSLGSEAGKGSLPLRVQTPLVWLSASEYFPFAHGRSPVYHDLPTSALSHHLPHLALLAEKSGGKHCLTKWLGMVFLRKTIPVGCCLLFWKARAAPCAVRGGRQVGWGCSMAAQMEKTPSFYLVCFTLIFSHLLSMHKSGKDFQVLYFVHWVYQDIIRAVVWPAGIPGGTSGASPALYQPGASAACAPGAAPALTWTWHRKDWAFQCFLSSS